MLSLLLMSLLAGQGDVLNAQDQGLAHPLTRHLTFDAFAPFTPTGTPVDGLFGGLPIPAFPSFWTDHLWFGQAGYGQDQFQDWVPFSTAAVYNFSMSGFPGPSSFWVYFPISVWVRIVPFLPRRGSLS